MSRPMKGEEIDSFEKKYGYKPTALPTAIDMLAVYVHKDNPITGLTFQQVDAIFSKSRKQGGDARTSRPGAQLGLKGECENLPISLYGRNSASGTYGYFKEHALAKGDFKDSVKEQPGSSAVVQGVASRSRRHRLQRHRLQDRRRPRRARSPRASGKPVPAETQYAYSGEYPLSRFLYVYLNYKPGSALDPLQRRVRQVRLQPRGAGGRRQGRLPPRDGEDRRRRPSRSSGSRSSPGSSRSADDGGGERSPPLCLARGLLAS